MTEHLHPRAGQTVETAMGRERTSTDRLFGWTLAAQLFGVVGLGIVVTESATQGESLGSFLIASTAALVVNVPVYLALARHKRRAAEREAALQDVKSQVEQEVVRKTRALKASVEQARTLIKITNVVPWELDAETLKFTYISSHAQHVFGSKLRQSVGAPFDFSVVAPEDRARVKTQFKALAACGDGEHLETEFAVDLEDGRRVQVRCLVTVHQEPGGAKLLRGVARDITPQKKVELELRHTQKLQSVGRLAAGVAHEINTPVQFVGDSVHFVRDVVGDLTTLIEHYQTAFRAGASTGDWTSAAAAARQAESEADLAYALEQLPRALDRSLEGLERVASIVRSMKEFAHPDQKEMMATNINQAIASTLTIARHEYKYVADIVTAFGDVPPVVCHAGDINQVLLNVIVNAAHAIADAVKESGARGRIEIATSCAGDQVEIRIADTGAGVPAAIRGRIFDPFFTTKEVGKGTGQGLALARSVVVDRHGGQLTFDSTVGVGTTFYIRLPRNGVCREVAA